MQYLILSDMHGNSEALAAVLRRVRRKRFDVTLVLGDLVGYGAGPNQVVESIRDLPGTVYRIRGNHDKVSPIEDAELHHAALAAALDREHMTAANLRFVRAAAGRSPCPKGSPSAMARSANTYVFSMYEAWEIFENYPAQLVFGHTHVPSLFVHRGARSRRSCMMRAARSFSGRPYWSIQVDRPTADDPRLVHDLRFGQAHRWHRVVYPSSAPSGDREGRAAEAARRALGPGTRHQPGSSALSARTRETKAEGLRGNDVQAVPDHGDERLRSRRAT
jgi:predicted phosphodiesterase